VVAGLWSPGNGVSGAEGWGLPPITVLVRARLPGGSTRVVAPRYPLSGAAVPVAGCARLPVAQWVCSGAVVPRGWCLLCCPPLRVRM